MLEIIDSGVAQINKREKAARLNKAYYPDQPTGQDAWVADKDNGVFAVADGVAQSPDADKAAQAACHEFLTRLTGSDRPQTAEQAKDLIKHHDLLGHLHRAALQADAMTTFTGMVVTPDDMMTYVHVGDSRLYLRRGDQIEALTSEQVIDNKYRNMLYNYLGYDKYYDRIRSINLTPQPNTMAGYPLAQAEWGTRQLQANDRFLLVTDGVTGDLDADRLSDETLLLHTSLKLGAAAAAYALVDRSTKIDDTTAVVFDIGTSGKTSV
ncbi:MAG TPA: protein phosphatase 2C domain-containing protein [Candidatus Saccharimonadales bacterium]|nr:protein phosphatase 2C domain-containing protein [Candidatus Saccharimonadales bacterium]